MSRHHRLVAGVIAAAAALAYPAFLNATAVIALRTPEAVFVAADTRGHVTGAGAQPPSSTCKIVAAHGTVLAFAGLTSVPAMKFTTRELLQKVLGPEMSFSERVRTLDQVMLTVLPKIVETAMKVSPDYARKLEASGGEVMAVLAAGIDQGVPQWVARNYFRRTIKGKVRYQAVYGRCGADCRPPGIALLGGTPELRRELERSKPDVLAADWQAGAHHLIAIGAKESPDTIALPATAVRVDAQGVHWLEEHPECRH
jgi:hypothetical protein